MGFAKKAIAAACAGFAASAIVGCGSGGGLLSSGQAIQLNGQLASASSALLVSHCGQAQSAIRKLEDRIGSLGSVDSTLVENLNQGASTIQSLIQRQCTTKTTSTASTPTTTTQTTVTTTATTTSIPTVTSTPTTTSTPVTTSQPTTTTGTTTNPGGGTGVGSGGSGL